MARKSKTQKAKASAARQARKAERKLDEVVSDDNQLVEAEADKEDSKSQSKSTSKLAKSESSKDSSKNKPAKTDKKSEDKPKKKRFQFLRDVRSELKRVTWPTKADVLRWSGVVVVALIFFGLFTYILDNFIVTPLLVLISGADPSSIDWFSALTGGEAIDSSSADTSAIDSSSADVSGDVGSDASNVSVDSAEAEVAEDANVAQDSAGE